MSYKSYVNQSPDLIKHYNKHVKSSGKSVAQWGKEHWDTVGGKNENRKVTPQNSQAAAPPSNTPGGNPNAVTPNYTQGQLQGNSVLPSANPANPTPSQYSGYVDNYTGMKNTWALIDMRLKGLDVSGMKGHQNMSPEATADYWVTRMGGGKNKSDFGKAHYGESKSLHEGSYKGGTKVPSGTGVRKFNPGNQPGADQPGGNQPPGGFPPYTPGGGPEIGMNDIEPMQLASITDNMMLSNAVSSMINTNSPLFRAAETRALQEAATRGIVNSSLAREAVMSAILQVAIPIAQADVQTLQQNLYYNTDWTNKQKTDYNTYIYDSLKTKLQGAINYTLRRGDWIAAIGSTPGLSAEATDWTVGNLPNYSFNTA
jgi:hypothetical protein